MEMSFKWNGIIYLCIEKSTSQQNIISFSLSFSIGGTPDNEGEKKTLRKDQN